MKFIETYNESRVNIQSIARIFYEMEEKTYALRIELNNGKILQVCEEFCEYYHIKGKSKHLFIDSDMDEFVGFLIDVINELEKSDDNFISYDELYQTLWNLSMENKGNI